MSESSLFVPLPSELVGRVIRFLETSGAVEPLNDVIEMFVDYGLHVAQRRHAGEYVEKSDNRPWLKHIPTGYLWKRSGKSLFLPEGTRILRRYKGQTYYAKVEGGAFMFDGTPYMSPAALARGLSGGTSVNAWTALWVQLPDSPEWKPASALAKEK